MPPAPASEVKKEKASSTTISKRRSVTTLWNGIMQRSQATDFPVQKLIPLKGNASGWHPIPGKLVRFIEALMWLSGDGDQCKWSLHHINPTVYDHNAHQWAAILYMRAIGVNHHHSPLRFMGRTRTATLTLESSRLGSPILTPTLRWEGNADPKETSSSDKRASKMLPSPNWRPASGVQVCSIGWACLLQENAWAKSR